MTDQQRIDAAAHKLLQAAPGAKVILFGSRARGDADAHSDVDFLVIEPEVSDRAAEIVRLLLELQPLRVAADVLVVSREDFEHWKETPNTVYYRASKEGKVYESAA